MQTAQHISKDVFRFHSWTITAVMRTPPTTNHFLHPKCQTEPNTCHTKNCAFSTFSVKSNTNDHKRSYWSSLEKVWFRICSHCSTLRTEDSKTKLKSKLVLVCQKHLFRYGDVLKAYRSVFAGYPRECLSWKFGSNIARRNS